MPSDRYAEIRIGARRARDEAELRADETKRRAEEIERYLVALRGSDAHHPAIDIDSKRHAGDAEARAQRSLERDRRAHERAARGHDLAAREHDRAADAADARQDPAGAADARHRAARELLAAAASRRAGAV